MFETELAQGVTHWLGTYFIHSTLLLATAWLVVRMTRLAAGSRELVWKVALIGSLATATIQVGFGLDPVLGQVTVGTASSQTAAAPPVSVEPAAEPGAIAGLLAVSRALGSSDRDAAPVVDAAGTRGGAMPWPVWVAGLWLAAAAVLVAVQLGRLLALRRRLASRQPITVGPLAAMMSELGGKRPPRLSMSDEVSVPIAFGILRGEICLPARAVHQLAASYQRTMLAHELAHLRRRDPLWRLSVSIMQSALFIQPLVRVAHRKLIDCSELACDEWAARTTREPLALAGCITEVARWMVPPMTAPVASMAMRGSELRGRIERLVGQTQRERNLPIWSLGALAVVLMAVVLVAPGLSNAAAAGPQSGLDQVMLAQAPAKDSARDKTSKSAAKPKSSGKSPAQPGKGNSGAKPSKKAKTSATPSKAPRTAEEKRVQRELEKAMRELMVLVKRDVQTSVDRAAIKKELDKARAEIRQQLAGQNGSLQKELAEARKEIEKARKEVQAEMKNLKVAGMDPAAISKMVDLSLDMAEKAMPSDKELGAIIESSLKLAEKSIPSDAEIDAIVGAALKAADAAIDKDLGAGLSDMSLDEMREALQDIREETRRLERNSPKKPGKGAK